MGFKDVPWADVVARWGIKVIGDINADIFGVELPAGWSLRHGVKGSLWSFLYDKVERERASIYYGPEKDGVGARMFLYRRYNIFTHYSDPGDHTVRIITGRDQARIFREFGRVFAGDATYFIEIDRIRAEGEAWFDKEYPGWRDPFAYWGDDQ